MANAERVKDAGTTVVAAPTGVLSIVGRIRVDGRADLPAVHAPQDQVTLTPLPVHQGEVDKGNHLVAWQEPSLFTTEVRAAFRSLR
jgi:Protein of unknown function (DUF1254)